MSRPWTLIWLALPIAWRSSIYLFLEKLGREKWGSTSGTVQKLSLGLYIKFGEYENIKSEALATMHVATHTTIPVPTVLDVVPHPRGACMIMTALPGYPAGIQLNRGILPRQVFEDTMRDWLSQLRALPTPSSDAVTNFAGGKLRCDRASDDRFGPFPSIAAFHRYVGCCPERIRPFTERSYSKPHRICFFHGDIHLHNVLAEDGKLTGLIDWECAGWWPEYWDYTIAMYFHRASKPWAASFNNIFPQYADELAAEMEIWKILS